MSNRKIFGFILILLGVFFLLNATGVIDVNIFFKGWWTLFLIVPALVSMSKQGVTTGNLILLVIGGLLLLREYDVDFEGYLLPGVLIVLGIGLFLKR
ncbi:MAG: DUF5668 domain-containing protein [Candidatus Izemoplasmatales bacterium]|nr:DUF5668 domain-containing protein [Candidatus Izemoplasmatales bacterium]MDY0138758.1 DUF5668 domain-containing protein [Candidatus Izemoplasmatales bacterium]